MVIPKFVRTGENGRGGINVGGKEKLTCTPGSPGSAWVIPSRQREILAASGTRPPPLFPVLPAGWMKY